MMKWLIVIAVVVVGYLLWRQARLPRAGEPKAGAARRDAPQEMVRCAVCAVHLPRGDAVAGRDGRLYCGAEHRQRAEG